MAFISSVIVDDLYVPCTGRSPAKADAELVVHTNAVLSGPFAFERLEAVPRGDTKVADGARDLELPQLAPRDRLDVSKAPNSLTVGERLRVGASKR
jgi:hypothetical protein